MAKVIFRLIIASIVAMLFLLSGHFLYAVEVSGQFEKSAAQVKIFTVFEIHLKAKDPGKNPYRDGPEVSVLFTGPDHTSVTVKGYWDGDNIFSIRFSPDRPGEWNYISISSDPGLNGAKGSFLAVGPSEKELNTNALYGGFLKADGYGWRLSDGKPFLPVGETQWSFTEEFYTEEWKDWVMALTDRGYNSFLGCIWLAKFNRAGISPFQGSPHEDILNEPFFDRLDEWVAFANEKGILMGLAIGGFPDNSQWFSLFNTKERNDRWFRYCVRRYAAYNVRWVLHGEVDEVNPPWSSWEQNTEATANLVREEDPYDHPIGSHHRYIDRATARSSNIDYLCIQSNRNSYGQMNAEYQFLTTSDYRQYGKPLCFEEYWYENMEGLEPGIHNTYRNFIAGLAFPTMGSLMRAHEPESGFVPRVAKNNNLSIYDYLTQKDTGMLYMKHFVDFFSDVDFLDFYPDPYKIGNPGLTQVCGRFGNSYVVYKMNGGAVKLNLTDCSGKFSVEKMDIRSGKRTMLLDVSAGSWCEIDSWDTDDVVFLVSGHNLPRYPEIISPLKNSEFIPAEKIYIKTNGEKSTLKVELLEGQKAFVLSVDSLSSAFHLPKEIQDSSRVKITAVNQWGTTSQVHHVIVDRKNKLPVLTRTIANIYSGEQVGIQLGFSDPDGPGPYLFKIVKGPANGVLSGSGNDRVYQSNPQFEGTDQFTWLVNDGLEDAEKAATVIIHVRKK